MQANSSDNSKQILKKEYMPVEGELSDPEELLQVRPLLDPESKGGGGGEHKLQSKATTKSTSENLIRPLQTNSHARVKIFNEDEESTKIIELIYLEKSYAKIILLVPLLAICTGLFFILFLYWYPKLRKIFFYSECTDVRRATHFFVVGTSKFTF
jgi:hypothetical protein